MLEVFLSDMGLHLASMSSEGVQKYILKGNEKIGLIRDFVETAALTPASEMGLWNPSATSPQVSFQYRKTKLRKGGGV